jgi:hypothetical protein
MLSTLVGCSSSAALDLLQAISDGDTTRTRALTATDGTLVTAADTITGWAGVHDALSTLPAGGRAIGHHDVAQLALPDAVLFAIGSEAVHSLALLEGDVTDGVPAALSNYVAAWNESDAARREALLDAFAASGRYVDPTVDAMGREALAAHLTDFRDSMPGTTLERSGRLHQAGDWYLFDWVMENGGITTPGTDIVQLDDDGRVVLVAGFF